MSDSTTIKISKERPVQSPPVRSDADLHVDMVVLACGASSTAGYFSDILDLLTRHFRGAYAAFEIRLPSQVITDYCHFGPSHPGTWKGLVEGAITDMLSETAADVKILGSQSGDVKAAVISAPVLDENEAVIGAVGMMIPCPDEATARAKNASLEPLMRLASSCAGFVSRAPNQGADDTAIGNVLSRASAYSSCTELAFAITNGLRNKTGCNQVGLGIVRGKKIRMISLSGRDEVKRRSTAVSAIEAAMEECLDSGRKIVHQIENNWIDEGICKGYRIHKQWYESAGGAPVASIPLFSADKCTAVVSLQRDPGKGFGREQLDGIESFLQPYAPALELVRLASRGPAACMRDLLARQLVALTKPGKWRAKITVGVLAALVGWFALGSMDYTITVPCSVEPANSMHFAVPHDARLTKAHAVAGDLVKKGDILCEFDSGEFQLERTRLEAELAIARLEYQRALAAGRTMEARLAEVTAKRLQASMDIVDGRIEGAVMRAPFDGVVTKGDLRRRQGQIIPRGEAIYELSSQDGWALKILVPESRIPAIAVDQSGRFASNARPEQMQDFRVTRVAPATIQHTGNSVYVIEAGMHVPPDWMQSGMEGTAKINAGSKPVWWIFTHRIVDFVRIKLWL